MAFKTNLTAGLRSQTFVASGNFTVPPGVANLIIVGSGGGGGGGGGSGGNSYPGTCCGNTYCGQGGVGGGGVYPVTYNLTVTPGQIVPIVVGAGGAGGNGGGTGVSGASGGIGTSSTVTAFAGTNQVQRIVFAGTPTSGAWQISFRGVYTVSLANNISAATLQTAIQNLSTVGAGEATVAGSMAAGFNVTFSGSVGFYNWVPMVVITNTLSPASAATVSILTPGVSRSRLLLEGGLGGAGGSEGTNLLPWHTENIGQAQTETVTGTVRTASGGGGGGGKGASSFVAATTSSSAPDTNFSEGGISGVPQYNLAGGGGGGAGIGDGGFGCQPYYANFTTQAEPLSQFARAGGYGAGGGGGCGDYNGTASHKNAGAGGSGIVIVYY